MTATPRERLYALLPALYRLRDGAANQTLRALLGVVEQQLQEIEDDVSGLYENWFIETCEPWVVPYLAQLLGINNLPQLGQQAGSQRTQVANTLSYRRRKGTPGVLVQLARDVCGWPARVVEYAPLVAATQHLARLQPALIANVDIRDKARLARVGTPFDPVARRADLRSIQRHLGRHNLPNVGLFIWRLRAFYVEAAPAARVQLARYTFHPCGVDMPLFAPDRVPLRRSGLESEVPAPLSTETVAAELVVRRKGVATPLFPLAPQAPVFTVLINGRPLPYEKLAIADLSDANANSIWLKLNKSSLPDQVTVDPQLGRLVLDKANPTAEVSVSYWYGSVGELGGGAYEQTAHTDPAAEPTPLVVSRDPKSNKCQDLESALVKAAASWAIGQPVIIEIADNQAYRFPRVLELPEGAQLSIRAAAGQRPVLLGPKLLAESGKLESDTDVKLAAAARLTLRGLMIIGGAIVVAAAAGSELTLSHCTLAPRLLPQFLSTLIHTGAALPDVSEDDFAVRSNEVVSTALCCSGKDYSVRIERSIVGRIQLTGRSQLVAQDSVLDNGQNRSLNEGDYALALTADHTQLARCTLFGNTQVAALELATDCLFMGWVNVDEPTGCMRFSYLNDEWSSTPLRYRCQPDLALRGLPPETWHETRQRLTPVFTSRCYGDPGYAQLAATNDEQLRRGGSNESEPGALGFLQLPQREAALQASVTEYLRLGFEAGIFFEN